jgi:hypothetical protein
MLRKKGFQKTIRKKRWRNNMVLTTKKESFSVREFLVGAHKQRNNSHNIIYGFMGIDITTKNFFSPTDFAMPYFIVFGVTGVILVSYLIESFFDMKGNTRKAERVNSITKFLLPVSFYIFLIIGIVKVL